MQRRTTLIAIVVIGLWVCLHWTPAAAETGAGTLKRAQFVSADDRVSTTSTDWVAVPEMTRSVWKSGLLVAQFCSELLLDPDQTLRLRVVVDGSPLSPSDVSWDDDGGAIPRESHCFTFAGVVEAGDHTVEVEFQSQFGGVVEIDERILLVQF